MLIKLVAFHVDLFYVWQKQFVGCADVEVLSGDILQHQAEMLLNVPPEQAAHQMRQAYDVILGKRSTTKSRSAREILVSHYKLLS